MKTKKIIQKIVTAQPVPLGGAVVEQALPMTGIEQIDPFLLIHHASFPVKAGRKQKDLGVGAHPHRGFSPVTFVFEGSVHHRDSMGNDKLVQAGGTQWIHAGSGIIHSERPGLDMLASGGANEIIQFWVNTPAKHKMDDPFYLPISKEETPKIEKDKATIWVVAGELEGVKGIAPTLTPQTLLRVETKKGADLSFEIPENYNTLMYLLDGELEINGTTVVAKQLIWFANEGTEIQMLAKKDTRAIVLSGEPIGEAVTSYGPFVMNTEEEIMQALSDSRKGEMGMLIENFED